MAVSKKPRAKKDPVIKSGELKCRECDSRAELSPPGAFCTPCRLTLADFTRMSYNKWKISRGLPVETKEQEISRIQLEKEKQL
jgi:hypothetical protein